MKQNKKSRKENLNKAYAVFVIYLIMSMGISVDVKAYPDTDEDYNNLNYNHPEFDFGSIPQDRYAQLDWNQIKKENINSITDSGTVSAIVTELSKPENRQNLKKLNAIQLAQGNNLEIAGSLDQLDQDAFNNALRLMGFISSNARILIRAGNTIKGNVLINGPHKLSLDVIEKIGATAVIALGPDEKGDQKYPGFSFIPTKNGKSLILAGDKVLEISQDSEGGVYVKSFNVEKGTFDQGQYIEIGKTGEITIGDYTISIDYHEKNAEIKSYEDKNGINIHIKKANSNNAKIGKIDYKATIFTGGSGLININDEKVTFDISRGYLKVGTDEYTDEYFQDFSATYDTFNGEHLEFTLKTKGAEAILDGVSVVNKIDGIARYVTQHSPQGNSVKRVWHIEALKAAYGKYAESLNDAEDYDNAVRSLKVKISIDKEKLLQQLGNLKNKGEIDLINERIESLETFEKDYLSVDKETSISLLKSEIIDTINKLEDLSANTLNSLKAGYFERTYSQIPQGMKIPQNLIITRNGASIGIIGSDGRRSDDFDMSTNEGYAVYSPPIYSKEEEREGEYEKYAYIYYGALKEGTGNLGSTKVKTNKGFIEIKYEIDNSGIAKAKIFRNNILSENNIDDTGIILVGPASFKKENGEFKSTINMIKLDKYGIHAIANELKEDSSTVFTEPSEINQITDKIKDLLSEGFGIGSASIENVGNFIEDLKEAVDIDKIKDIVQKIRTNSIFNTNQLDLIKKISLLQRDRDYEGALDYLDKELLENPGLLKDNADFENFIVQKEIDLLQGAGRKEDVMKKLDNLPDTFNYKAIKARTLLNYDPDDIIGNELLAELKNNPDTRDFALGLEQKVKEAKQNQEFDERFNDLIKQGNIKGIETLIKNQEDKLNKNHHLTLSDIYLKQGDSKTAQDHAEKANDLHSINLETKEFDLRSDEIINFIDETTQVIMKVAEASYYNKDYQSTESSAGIALAVNGRNIDAQKFLGSSFTQRGMFTEAVDNWEKFIDNIKEDDDKRMYTDASINLMEVKRLAKGENNFKDIDNIYEEIKVILSQDKDLKEEFEKNLKDIYTNSLYLQGYEALDEEDYVKAEEKLRKLVGVDPDNVDGKKTLAHVYLKREKITDAKKIYEDLYDESKLTIDEKGILAELRASTNEISDAKNLLTEIAKEYEDKNDLKNAAINYFKADEKEDAIRIAEKLKEGSAQEKFIAAEIYSGNNQQEEALVLYEKAAEENSADAQYYLAQHHVQDEDKNAKYWSLLSENDATPENLKKLASEKLNEFDDNAEIEKIISSYNKELDAAENILDEKIDEATETSWTQWTRDRKIRSLDEEYASNYRKLSSDTIDELEKILLETDLSPGTEAKILKELNILYKVTGDKARLTNLLTVKIAVNNREIKTENDNYKKLELLVAQKDLIKTKKDLYNSVLLDEKKSYIEAENEYSTFNKVFQIFTGDDEQLELKKNTVGKTFGQYSDAYNEYLSTLSFSELQAEKNNLNLYGTSLVSYDSEYIAEIESGLKDFQKKTVEHKIETNILYLEQPDLYDKDPEKFNKIVENRVESKLLSKSILNNLNEIESKEKQIAYHQGLSLGQPGTSVIDKLEDAPLLGGLVSMGAGIVEWISKQGYVELNLQGDDKKLLQDKYLLMHLNDLNYERLRENEKAMSSLIKKAIEEESIDEKTKEILTIELIKTRFALDEASQRIYPDRYEDMTNPKGLEEYAAYTTGIIKTTQRIKGTLAEASRDVEDTYQITGNNIEVYEEIIDLHNKGFTLNEIYSLRSDLKSAAYGKLDNPSYEAHKPYDLSTFDINAYWGADRIINPLQGVLMTATSPIIAGLGMKGFQFAGKYTDDVIVRLKNAKLNPKISQPLVKTIEIGSAATKKALYGASSLYKTGNIVEGFIAKAPIIAPTVGKIVTKAPTLSKMVYSPVRYVGEELFFEEMILPRVYGSAGKGVDTVTGGRSFEGVAGQLTDFFELAHGRSHMNSLMQEHFALNNVKADVKDVYFPEYGEAKLIKTDNQEAVIKRLGLSDDIKFGKIKKSLLPDGTLILKEPLNPNKQQIIITKNDKFELDNGFSVIGSENYKIVNELGNIDIAPVYVTDSFDINKIAANLENVIGLSDINIDVENGFVTATRNDKKVIYARKDYEFKGSIKTNFWGKGQYASFEIKGRFDQKEINEIKADIKTIEEIGREFSINNPNVKILNRDIISLENDETYQRIILGNTNLKDIAEILNNNPNYDDVSISNNEVIATNRLTGKKLILVTQDSSLKQDDFMNIDGKDVKILQIEVGEIFKEDILISDNGEIIRKIEINENQLLFQSRLRNLKSNGQDIDIIHQAESEDDIIIFIQNNQKTIVVSRGQDVGNIEGIKVKSAFNSIADSIKSDQTKETLNEKLKESINLKAEKKVQNSGIDYIAKEIAFDIKYETPENVIKKLNSYGIIDDNLYLKINNILIEDFVNKNKESLIKAQHAQDIGIEIEKYLESLEELGIESGLDDFGNFIYKDYKSGIITESDVKNKVIINQNYNDFLTQTALIEISEPKSQEQFKLTQQNTNRIEELSPIYFYNNYKNRLLKQPDIFREAIENPSKRISILTDAGMSEEAMVLASQGGLSVNDGTENEFNNFILEGQIKEAKTIDDIRTILENSKGLPYDDTRFLTSDDLVDKLDFVLKYGRDVTLETSESVLMELPETIGLRDKVFEVLKKEVLKNSPIENQIKQATSLNDIIDTLGYIEGLDSSAGFLTENDLKRILNEVLNYKGDILAFEGQLITLKIPETYGLRQKVIELHQKNQNAVLKSDSKTKIATKIDEINNILAKLKRNNPNSKEFKELDKFVSNLKTWEELNVITLDEYGLPIEIENTPMIKDGELYFYAGGRGNMEMFVDENGKIFISKPYSKRAYLNELFGTSFMKKMGFNSPLIKKSEYDGTEYILSEYIVDSRIINDEDLKIFQQDFRDSLVPFLLSNVISKNDNDVITNIDLGSRNLLASNNELFFIDFAGGQPMSLFDWATRFAYFGMVDVSKGVEQFDEQLKDLDKFEKNLETFVEDQFGDELTNEEKINFISAKRQTIENMRDYLAGIVDKVRVPEKLENINQIKRYLSEDTINLINADQRFTDDMLLSIFSIDEFNNMEPLKKREYVIEFQYNLYTLTVPLGNFAGNLNEGTERLGNWAKVNFGIENSNDFHPLLINRELSGREESLLDLYQQKMSEGQHVYSLQEISEGLHEIGKEKLVVEQKEEQIEPTTDTVTEPPAISFFGEGIVKIDDFRVNMGNTVRLTDRINKEFKGMLAGTFKLRIGTEYYDIKIETTDTDSIDTTSANYKIDKESKKITIFTSIPSDAVNLIKNDVVFQDNSLSFWQKITSFLRITNKDKIIENKARDLIQKTYAAHELGAAFYTITYDEDINFESNKAHTFGALTAREFSKDVRISAETKAKLQTYIEQTTEKQKEINKYKEIALSSDNSGTIRGAVSALQKLNAKIELKEIALKSNNIWAISEAIYRLYSNTGSWEVLDEIKLSQPVKDRLKEIASNNDDSNARISALDALKTLKANSELKEIALNSNDKWEIERVIDHLAHENSVLEEIILESENMQAIQRATFWLKNNEDSYDRKSKFKKIASSKPVKNKIKNFALKSNDIGTISDAMITLDRLNAKPELEEIISSQPLKDWVKNFIQTSDNEYEIRDSVRILERLNAVSELKEIALKTENIDAIISATDTLRNLNAIQELYEIALSESANDNSRTSSIGKLITINEKKPDESITEFLNTGAIKIFKEIATKSDNSDAISSAISTLLFLNKESELIEIASFSNNRKAIHEIVGRLQDKKAYSVLKEIAIQSDNSVAIGSAISILRNNNAKLELLDIVLKSENREAISNAIEALRVFSRISELKENPSIQSFKEKLKNFALSGGYSSAVESATKILGELDAKSELLDIALISEEHKVFDYVFDQFKILYTQSELEENSLFQPIKIKLKNIVLSNKENYPIEKTINYLFELNAKSQLKEIGLSESTDAFSRARSIRRLESLNENNPDQAITNFINTDAKNILKEIALNSDNSNAMQEAVKALEDLIAVNELIDIAKTSKNEYSRIYAIYSLFSLTKEQNPEYSIAEADSAGKKIIFDFLDNEGKNFLRQVVSTTENIDNLEEAMDLMEDLGDVDGIFSGFYENPNIEIRQGIAQYMSKINPKQSDLYFSLVHIEPKNTGTASLMFNNDAGIVPTNYLAEIYSESNLEEWKKLYNEIVQKKTKLDASNKLHQELMYTKFRDDIDCCFSNSQKYTYETYISVFNQPDADFNPSLEAEQESELVYAGYEASRAFKKIISIADKLKKIGKEILVVPNYSYGRFVIEPIEKELEKNDIKVKPSRIGSTESHSDNYLISAANTDQLFDDGTIEYLLEKRPQIVMLDGSNSYARGRDARYPDAQKGYVNFAILMNIAIKNSLIKKAKSQVEIDSINQEFDSVNMYRTEEHIQELENRHSKMLEKMESMLKESNSHEFFDVNYWNPANTALSLTQGLHESREVVEKVPSAQNDDIKGAGMLVINSVFNDGYDDVFVPDNIKQKGNNKDHESAYFDDTSHIQKIMFKLGPYGVEITDEVFKKIRNEFLEFHYENSPTYTAIVDSNLLTLKQATDMRIHRLKGKSNIKSEIERKIKKRGIELTDGQIKTLEDIVNGEIHDVSGVDEFVEEDIDAPLLELNEIEELKQSIDLSQTFTSEENNRIKEAENLLSRELSSTQKQAIIDAHNIGEGELGTDGGPARVGFYTEEQIARKTEVLNNAGFTRGDNGEIRKLMEAGIVGVEDASENVESEDKESIEKIKKVIPISVSNQDAAVLNKLQSLLDKLESTSEQDARNILLNDITDIVDNFVASNLDFKKYLESIDLLDTPKILLKSRSILDYAKTNHWVYDRTGFVIHDNNRAFHLAIEKNIDMYRNAHADMYKLLQDTYKAPDDELLDSFVDKQIISGVFAEPETVKIFKDNLKENLQKDLKFIEFLNEQSKDISEVIEDLTSSFLDGEIKINSDFNAYTYPIQTAVLNAFFNSKIWKSSSGKKVTLFEYATLIESAQTNYFGNVLHKRVDVKMLPKDQYITEYVKLSGGDTLTEQQKEDISKKAESTPGVYFRFQEKILIRSDLSLNQIIQTYLHESAHFIQEKMRQESEISGIRSEDFRKLAEEGMAEDFSYHSLLELSNAYRQEDGKDHGFDIARFNLMGSDYIVNIDNFKSNTQPYFVGSILVKSIRDTVGISEFQDNIINPLLEVSYSLEGEGIGWFKVTDKVMELAKENEDAIKKEIPKLLEALNKDTTGYIMDRIIQIAKLYPSKESMDALSELIWTYKALEALEIMDYYTTESESDKVIDNLILFLENRNPTSAVGKKALSILTKYENKADIIILGLEKLTKEWSKPSLSDKSYQEEVKAFEEAINIIKKANTQQQKQEPASTSFFGEGVFANAFKSFVEQNSNKAKILKEEISEAYESIIDTTYNGQPASTFKLQGYEVILVEPSSDSIDIAKANYEIDNKNKKIIVKTSIPSNVVDLLKNDKAFKKTLSTTQGLKSFLRIINKNEILGQNARELIQKTYVMHELGAAIYTIENQENTFRESAEAHTFGAMVANENSKNTPLTLETKLEIQKRIKIGYWKERAASTTDGASEWDSLNALSKLGAANEILNLVISNELTSDSYVYAMKFLQDLNNENPTERVTEYLNSIPKKKFKERVLAMDPSIANDEHTKMVSEVRWLEEFEAKDELKEIALNTKNEKVKSEVLRSLKNLHATSIFEEFYSSDQIEDDLYIASIEYFILIKNENPSSDVAKFLSIDTKKRLSNIALKNNDKGMMKAISALKNLDAIDEIKEITLITENEYVVYQSIEALKRLNAKSDIIDIAKSSDNSFIINTAAAALMHFNEKDIVIDLLLNQNRNNKPVKPIFGALNIKYEGSTIFFDEINPNQNAVEIIAEFIKREDKINNNRVVLYFIRLNKHANDLINIKDSDKRWKEIKKIIAKADSDYLNFLSDLYYGKQVNDYSLYYPEMYKIDGYEQSIISLAQNLNINTGGKGTLQLFEEIDSKIATVDIKEYVGEFEFEKTDVQFSFPENFEGELRTTMQNALNSEDEIDISNIQEKIKEINEKAGNFDEDFLKEHNVAPGLIKVAKERNDASNIKNFIYKNMELSDSEINTILKSVFERLDINIINRFVENNMENNDLNLLITKLKESDIILEDFMADKGIPELTLKIQGSAQWGIIKRVKHEFKELEDKKGKSSKDVKVVFTNKNLIDLFQGNSNYCGTCFGDYPHDMNRPNIINAKIIIGNEWEGGALFAIQENKLILVGFDPSQGLLSGLSTIKQHELTDKVMEEIYKFAKINNFELLITEEAGGLSNKDLGGYIMDNYATKDNVDIQEIIFHPQYKYKVNEAHKAKQMDVDVSEQVESEIIQIKEPIESTTDTVLEPEPTTSFLESNGIVYGAALADGTITIDIRALKLLKEKGFPEEFQKVYNHFYDKADKAISNDKKEDEAITGLKRFVIAHELTHAALRKSLAESKGRVFAKQEEEILANGRARAALEIGTEEELLNDAQIINEYISKAIGSGKLRKNVDDFKFSDSFNGAYGEPNYIENLKEVGVDFRKVHAAVGKTAFYDEEGAETSYLKGLRKKDAKLIEIPNPYRAQTLALFKERFGIELDESSIDNNGNQDFSFEEFFTRKEKDIPKMIKDHKVYQSIKDESILSDVILNEKFQEFKETNKYKEMMTKRRFTKNNNIDMLNKLEEQYSRQAILKLNELQYEQAHKNGFNLLDTTDQDFLSKKQEIEDAGGEIVDIPLSKFVFFVKNPSDTITLYRGVADQTKGETENYIKEGLPERSVDIYNKYSLDYIKSPEFLEEYTPARENDDPRISFAVITTSDRGIASGYSRDLPDGDDSSYFYEFEIPKELGIFYKYGQPHFEHEVSIPFGISEKYIKKVYRRIGDESAESDAHEFVANYELIYKQQEEKSKYQDEIEDAINSGSPLINALAET